MKKVKGIKTLKKDLWKIFSKYIRMRDSGTCFSCGKVLPDYYDRHGHLLAGWKSGQAGHFITAKNCGIELYFHEQNVHCQCYHCNINLSGNWLEYEKRMIQVYGKKFVEALKQIKWKSTMVMTVECYLKKIDYYKNKLKELEEQECLPSTSQPEEDQTNF